jgi:hypothetical protein
MYGFAFDTTTADLSSATAADRINLNATTEGLSFEYSVPLIGILGSNCDKMIPVGKLMGLRLELTCDTPGNFIAATTASVLLRWLLNRRVHSEGRLLLSHLTDTGRLRCHRWNVGCLLEEW